MFCQKCGTQVLDDAKFCASCGAQFGGAQSSSSTGQSYQEGQPYQTGQSYQAGQGYQAGQSYQAYQQPVMHAQMSPEADVQQNKAMAIIAYFIFFIPLIAAKESQFARYHANQGLILLIFGVGLGIISGILSAVAIAAFSFGLLSIVGILMTILSIGLLVLGIIGIVNAAQGKMKPMPVIGSLFNIIK